MRNIFFATAMTLFLFAFSSCKKNGPTVHPGNEFTLSFGKTATIHDESADKKFTLEFDKVIEDSRCPQDVNCIWEGQVTIELRLDCGKNAVQVSSGESNNTVTWGNYKIKLVKISPETRSTDQEIKQKNYKATLVVY